MTKKICIISAIVLLATLVAGAVLAPIAIADIAASTASIDPSYAATAERLVIPADGVNTVSFDNGNHIRNLKVLPSMDNKIRVWSDGYTDVESQFSYALDVDQGHLEIGRYDRSAWNSLSWLSRENLPIWLSKTFGGQGSHVSVPKDPYVELYLPEGIAYDMDSYVVNHTQADPAVEIYYASKTGDYNQELPSEPQTLLETDETSQAAQMEQQDFAKLVRENGLLMLDAYRAYAQTGDSGAFWQAAEPIASRMAEAYANRVNAVDALGQWQDEDMTEPFYDYILLCLEEGCLELDQLRLERDYREGRIEKSDFYQADLELDAEQEELEFQMDQMDAAEDLMEAIEEQSGLDDILFTDSFDPEHLDF